MSDTFAEMLSGGHHNSLGRTEEVVAIVLAHPDRLDDLFACYDSPDEVVRMRTSSVLKRIEKARHDLMVPFISHLIETVGTLDQPSAQWTLAQLFEELARDMTPAQLTAAKALLKHNLATKTDWIVLIQTMKTLHAWANADADIATWLHPHLERLSKDPRKSVAKNAAKLRASLR